MEIVWITVGAVGALVVYGLLERAHSHRAWRKGRRRWWAPHW